jgi:phosphate transport system substrate-binding protein
MRKRSIIIVLALVLAVGLVGVLTAGCGGTTTTTQAPATTTTAGGETTTTETKPELNASLNGAGATFPAPLYLEWIGEFTQKVEPGVRMNYQGIGSGGGIQQFMQMTVDFGGTDAPMKDEEIAEAEAEAGAKVMHIPTVFGAVTVAFNLQGVDELKLDQDTSVDIFLGEITKWNDPRLVALNEGVDLPDQGIQICHRSDSSGTTDIFTNYLTAISDKWADKVGKGKEVQWPVGLGGQGNDGVTALILQSPGSIGYVELSYALESNLPTATLKNKSGNFIKPSLESTSAAAVGITYPDDLRFSLVDGEGPEAYPIVGATWVLVYDKMSDPAKAAALQAFLVWALTEGDALAKELNYAPLPDELEAVVLDKLSTMQ